jgi:Flp pilus assembly pilin Flp
MFPTIKTWTRRFIEDERGVQHAEEALILALIAVASVTIVTTLGNDIAAVFTSADTALQAAAAP